MSKHIKFILSLVLIAFLVRVLVIWVGRPEFVGWFNHTYYYYVETKGLLQNGQLPFPDMPLLFYVYAGTAKVLMFFGMEMHHTIVSSTRFWMSLIPSLLPIPIFLTVKNSFREYTIPYCSWVFLFACAFYPLSILHMPEFLQKNVLGLLLLAIFIYQSKLAFAELNLKRVLILCIIFLIILFTHFGTSATALLYLASMAIVTFMHKSKKRSLKLVFIVFVGFSIALITFYFTDVHRFNRVGYYLDRIFDSSSLGLLFSPYDPDKFTTIFMLVIPLAIVLLFYKWYRSAKAKLSMDNSLFWLTQIIFCYLLVLPIYEPLLMARFANFLGLPLVFILIFMIEYYIVKNWVKNALLGLVVAGTLTIGFGDIVSSFWHNKNKEVIYEDLIKMKKTVGLTNNDLIITRNGVEHISNWFLNTKSCLITSFNIKDLSKYERVFILNPTEGSMRLPISTNKATQWYNYMLTNIQIPSNAKNVYKSEHIEFYEIDSQPKEWLFENSGNWKNYKKE